MNSQTPPQQDPINEALPSSVIERIYRKRRPNKNKKKRRAKKKKLAPKIGKKGDNNPNQHDGKKNFRGSRKEKADKEKSEKMKKEVEKHPEKYIPEPYLESYELAKRSTKLDAEKLITEANLVKDPFRLYHVARKSKLPSVKRLIPIVESRLNNYEETVVSMCNKEEDIHYCRHECNQLVESLRSLNDTIMFWAEQREKPDHIEFVVCSESKPSSHYIVAYKNKLVL